MRKTIGQRIAGEFGYVIGRGTSACYGGPGETPYLDLEIQGRTWTWWTTDERILQIPVGESVVVFAFAYAKSGTLRRVHIDRMLDDGRILSYGM